MLVKNISKKIIHVNNVMILPDETKTFPDDLKNNPVVSMFANMKLLEVIEQKQPKANKPDPTPASDPQPDVTPASTDDTANQQNADDTETKPAEKKGKAKNAK